MTVQAGRYRLVVLGGELLAGHARLDPLRYHLGHARGQAELAQIMIRGLTHRHDPLEQPGKPDRVLDVGPDHRFGGARPDHPGQLEGLLLIPAAVALMLDHQVGPEAVPARQHRELPQRRQRLELKGGEGPGAHHLLHCLRHRGHLKVEIHRVKDRDPGGELTEELQRFRGMRRDQRFPRRGIGDPDLEVQRLGYPAQRHLAGHRHLGGLRLVAGRIRSG
ncbi:MAG TPA: hypothetical protein VHR41_13025 [Gemmatimonadales bacterium]|nr:hypothetical protein [Gemmatimonadales bacterium]